MKASKIAFIIFVYIFGVIAGIYISKLNGAVIDPVDLNLHQGGNGTHPAMNTRFDQLEARLTEMTVMLNRLEGQRLGEMAQKVNEIKTIESGPSFRNTQMSAPPKSGVTDGNFEAVKGRILNSLQDPTTNFSTLMNSEEMRSLSLEQQEIVAREITARLDSGQLNKEQFLPGYKVKAGVR